MRPGTRTSLAAALMLFPLICSTEATVYRVGPGQKYSKVSQVAERLRAGDVVEITGDISDSAIISASGTPDKPLTIRGVTSIENGRILRPQVSPASATCPFTLKVSADWVVLEGLGFTGFMGQEITKAAVVMAGGNVVVRNCHFHHNLRSLATDFDVARELLVEFCEFESDGYGSLGPTTLYSKVPGATATVQHCYFHSNVGNHLLRIGYPRNVIRYNWFEDQCHFAAQITTPALFGGKDDPSLADKVLPAHSDIVGNVFASGWGSNTYGALQIGGSAPEAPGTEGDFNIAHNLFIGRRAGEVAFIPIVAHGNVDKINVYNSAFLDCRYGGCRVYERDQAWPSAYRSGLFRRRRGSDTPTIVGANNWVSESVSEVPSSFSNTRVGARPFLAGLVDYDFHPLRESLLVGGSMWPLPRGRIVNLAPEFEPQRGIPLDLKPRVRRKVEKPSIGPFEAVEEDPSFIDDSEELVLGVRDVDTAIQWQLNFGKARRMSLEYLAKGEPDKALQCAKMQFLLSPPDDGSLDLAIDSVREALIAVDGNELRARTFEEYARYGSHGRDGQRGTNDDLLDPIRGVALDLFRKPNQYYEQFDRATDARKAMCVEGAYYAYWWETHWFETEKVFERTNRGQFEAASGLLVPMLIDAMRYQSPLLSRRDAGMRHQNLLDRVRENMRAVLRARCDSSYGIDGRMGGYERYARYGPAGPDGIMGTPDDIQLCDAASAQPAGVAGNAGDGVAAGDGRLADAWSSAIASSRAIVRHKLDLIKAPTTDLLLAGFRYACPTAREIYSQLCCARQKPADDAPIADGGDRESDGSGMITVQSVDEYVVDAYADLLASGMDDHTFTQARTYLAALVLGTHQGRSLRPVLTALRRLKKDGNVSLYVLEDTVVRLDDPFVGAVVYDALLEVPDMKWSDDDKRQWLRLIERTQYSHLKSLEGEDVRAGFEKEATDHVMKVKECETYLTRFSDSANAGDVRILKIVLKLSAHDYGSALADAQEFVAGQKQSPLLPKALFLESIAMLALGQTGNGIPVLLSIPDRFPQSAIAPQALYAAGEAYVRLQEYSKARDCFMRLVDFYAGDECAAKARNAVSKLEAKTGSGAAGR